MAEEQKRVQVVFSVKNDQFNKTLSETKKQIQITASEMQVAGQKVNLYGKNLQTLGNMQKTLQTQITNVTSKMKLYEESIAKNTTKVEENKKKLEELKNKKKELTEQYKASVKATGEDSEASLKLKDALEQCKSEYQETNNQIKNGVKAINNHTVEANKSEAELLKLQQQLKQVDKAIAENSNQFLQASKKMETAGKKLETFGVNVSGIGTKLMALGAPFVAFAGYSVKVGADYEKAMSTVQGTSQASSTEIEKLSKKSKQLGEDIKGASATDVAKSFNYLSLAGYDVNQMMESIEPNVKAALAFNIDMATSTDLCTDSLSALGKGAEYTKTYLDTLSNAQSKCNSSGEQLMQAYIGCGGMFRDWNTPLAESTSLLGILANRGLKGSEAGTSMNSVLVNLIGTTSKTSAALETLKVKAYDDVGNFRGVETILKDCAKAMGTMTDAQKDSISAALGGKTQMDTFKALIAGINNEYDGLKTNIENSDGALEKLYQTMTNNTKGNVEAFKSKLEKLGIQLSEHLLPHINDLLDKGMELIDWFSNLGEGTQKAILYTGLFTFATGGALKAIGSMSTGMGSVLHIGSKVLGALGSATTATTATAGAVGTLEAGAGAASVSVGGLASGLGGVLLSAGPLLAIAGGLAATIYAVHENNELLNTSLNTTTEELSPLQRLWNDMDGGIIKSREEMEKLGLIHHDWSDNVAPDTQEAINKTAKCWQDMNLEIKNSEVNNIAIDASAAQRLQQQTSDVCNTIIQEIKNKQVEANKSLGEYFNVDSSLDSYEQSLLSFFDSSSLEQQKKVTECKDKINAIYQQASEEHRALTNAENTQIGTLQQEMSNVQIDTLAKANEEKLELQANFNVKMRNVDMEGASELMEQKAQERDDNIAKDTEYYDEKIELLSSNMHNMNQSQQIAAQEQINKLKDEKEKKLQIDRETYNGYLKTIEEKYPEIADRIDLYTGKILSDQEYKNKQDLEREVEHYSNINGITESGMQRLYNTSTKTWDDVYVNIDENTGKINGVWNKSKDNTLYVNDEINSSLQELKGKYNYFTEGQKNDLLACISSNDNYSESTKAMASFVAGQLQGTGREVNGLYTEVINCNGTPVEVKVNKDGTIANIDEVTNKINSIPTFVPVSVRVTYYDENGNPFSGNKNASNGYGYDANGNPVSHNALGTANSLEGLSYVNEEGPELFDSVTSAARSIASEMAYLPAHTRVSNALMTTAKMNHNIQQEVNRQLTSKLVRALTTKVSGSNGSTDMLLSTLASILREQTNVIKNKSTDVYMDSSKVTNTVDRISGNKGQLERRLNGWDK